LHTRSQKKSPAKKTKGTRSRVVFARVGLHKTRGRTICDQGKRQSRKIGESEGVNIAGRHHRQDEDTDGRRAFSPKVRQREGGGDSGPIRGLVERAGGKQSVIKNGIRPEINREEEKASMSGKEGLGPKAIPRSITGQRGKEYQDREKTSLNF